MSATPTTAPAPVPGAVTVDVAAPLAVPVRHRLVAWLGVVGGALGIVVGTIQVTLGSRIPAWTGNKEDPVRLGLLTMALSALAVGVAAWQRRSADDPATRSAAALGLLVPGLLCLTTAGRLWLVPAALLLPAAVLAVDDWRATQTAVRRSWSRCLLAGLGATELLMAAGGSPPILLVGALGGLALIGAAWLTRLSRRRRWTLVILGTVPFAAIAWSGIVPVLLLLVAAGVTLLLPAPGPPARS